MARTVKRKPLVELSQARLDDEQQRPLVIVAAA